MLMDVESDKIDGKSDQNDIDDTFGELPDISGALNALQFQQEEDAKNKVIEETQSVVDVLLEEEKRNKEDRKKMIGFVRGEKEFPDEVDVPLDTSARERFSKYRGMRSFQSSPWDTKENLPPEYSRIFAFASSGQTSRASLKESDIWVRENERQKIPENIEDKQNDKEQEGDKQSYSMEKQIDHQLDKENKQSFPLHDQLHPHKRPFPFQPGDIVTITLKDMPEVNFGLNTLVIASTYAPITFGKVPVLMFRNEEQNTPFNLQGDQRQQEILEERKLGKDQNPFAIQKQTSFMSSFSQSQFGQLRLPFTQSLIPSQPQLSSNPHQLTLTQQIPTTLSLSLPSFPLLVANGSTYSIDPDRLIIKRIILTGYPVKIHKGTSAIIRYMFFSPDDINWFKPVDLWTKKGKLGRIKEPLGTHGYFKAIFSGRLDQAETVCMSLYKRVFPQWNF
ncbi:MAG: putative pre-rRNA-processing protein TSR1 [Streblomastix strix]|uniref:Putative pre-rRNA-processing protein TSR1 n=1 Tax=Streblomastix strix TaxID=222440 RepID=A0A5J4WVE6_9EUKA|nr:MAG: putative pre-rRNA-processing protein TSR1 [Streblomastix strix]KAA6398904.1 MAG: putative pre-rRNA-processing protein TSR1 [Streblomastix strix]